MKEIRRLIMLETDRANTLVKCRMFNKDRVVITSKVLEIQDEEKYQALYLLDEQEEIKNGDYYYNEIAKQIFVCNHSMPLYEGKNSKVITTTKEEFHKKNEKFRNRNIVPQIHPDFIKLYVKMVEWIKDSPLPKNETLFYVNNAIGNFE